MQGSDDLLITALKAALFAKEELPLLRVGKAPGCFPAAETEAAQAALDDGLLENVRTEAKGKAAMQWVRLTARGLQFLKARESPRSALEDAAKALALNAAGVPAWAAELKAQLAAVAHRLDQFLENQERTLRQLQARVEAACRRAVEEPLGPPADLPAWRLDLLAALEEEPRPVPFSLLFVRLARRHAELTLTAFHAGLLELRARRLLELLPAASPAEELAEPEFALPDGGAIYVAAGRA